MYQIHTPFKDSREHLSNGRVRLVCYGQIPEYSGVFLRSHILKWAPKEHARKVECYQKYSREIYYMLTPLLFEHGAPVGVYWVYPLIKIAVIHQVHISHLHLLINMSDKPQGVQD